MKKLLFCLLLLPILSACSSEYNREESQAPKNGQTTSEIKVRPSESSKIKDNSKKALNIASLEMNMYIMLMS